MCTEAKRPLGRPNCSKEEHNNIKMDLREVKCVCELNLNDSG